MSFQGLGRPAKLWERTRIQLACGEQHLQTSTRSTDTSRTVSATAAKVKQVVAVMRFPLPWTLNHTPLEGGNSVVSIEQNVCPRMWSVHLSRLEQCSPCRSGVIHWIYEGRDRLPPRIDGPIDLGK